VRRDNGGTYYSACKHITIPKNEAEIQSARAMGMDKQSTYTYFGDMTSRILNEVNIMYALRGESNIVTYEDHYIAHTEGTLRWDVFIRMELLVPLSAYVTDNTMEPEEVRRLGVEICNALEACEAYKIIHRDIKEGNIFLNPRGTFKLGDFGIARELMGGSMNMSMRGTPSYVAPEVYNGKPYDATVDLYSLGILMYKLLNNNRYPFFPPAPQTVSVEHSEQAFAMRMQGAVPSWPANGDDALRSAVMKVISFDPRQRFQSASEMKAALLSRSVISVPKAVTTPVFASVSPNTPRPVPQPQAYTPQPQASYTSQPQAPYMPQPQTAPVAAASPAYAPVQQGTSAYSQPKKSNPGVVLGLIGGAVLIIALLAVLLSGNGFGASEKYKKALAFEVTGSYEEALELFSEIPKYEDSAEHIDGLRLKLVDRYLTDGDALSAASTLNSVSYEEPTSEQSEQLLYYQIRVHFAQQQYDEAFSGITSLYASQEAVGAYEAALMDSIAAWMTDSMSMEEVLALQTQYADNRMALKVIDNGVYAKATALLNAEDTANAKSLFDSLGTYEDATDLSKECVYRDAQKAFDAGNFEEAQTLFTGIASYRDAKDKANLSLYRLACTLFSNEDYEAAFADFSILNDASYTPDDTFIDDRLWQFYDVSKAFYAAGDYQNALTGFDLAGSYERSLDYWTLSLIHIYGASTDDIDQLVPLIGLEDASVLLLSNFDIAWAFLEGEWSCGSGSLKFNPDEGLIFSLRAPDFGDAWGIADGLIYFFDRDDEANTKNAFFLTIISENEMTCYAYDNGNTYTLKRK
jgi:serine/threonine protein kinase/outer membrane protein assembly factor BamD (BamD/ComL family)